MEGLLDLWGLPNFFVALINSTISTCIGVWLARDHYKRQIERLRERVKVLEAFE